MLQRINISKYINRYSVFSGIVEKVKKEGKSARFCLTDVSTVEGRACDHLWIKINSDKINEIEQFKNKKVAILGKAYRYKKKDNTVKYSINMKDISLMN